MKAGLRILVCTVMLGMFPQLVVAQTIFKAIASGDTEQVETLLKEKPELLNKINEQSGFTPLLAAVANNKTDVCRLLIGKGADIHTPDKLQRNALHYAAYLGNLEMINMLVEKGIDPDVPDGDGSTPMLWATYSKKASTLQELHKLGANINPPLRNGRTVLQMAAMSSSPEVINYLLENGALLEQGCNYNNTPLMWAVIGKNAANTSLLIEKGADINTVNSDLQTPLSFAVGANDTETVKLLSGYIDLKKPTSTGDNCLHAAAYHGHKEMVQLLLEKGVDHSLINDKGFSPLDLAILRRHTEVQQLLKAAGAKHGTADNKPAQNPEIAPLGKGIENPVKVSIIYDNYGHKEGMEPDWGFSCLIEGTEKAILFDTGTQSKVFLHNMKELGIDPHQAEMLILSHEHTDHTGGVFSYLKLHHDLPVIMPYSFPYSFVRNIDSFGATTQTPEHPVEVCKDVYLSGELDAKIVREQALAINTPKGLVVISGCSHSGIVNILQRFKEVLKKDIYMVLGGFHTMNKTDEQIATLVAKLKELGIQKCGASHCTGDRQIELIKKAFGDDYVPLGVGRVLTF